jgi:16S rRNA (cytosine967-C5)-methyltransferase
LHKNRLSLVRSGAERLGLKSIITDARDGRTPDESLFGKADAVICDVPCSGLGVIAKKPDIRYKNKDDIERLPEVQAKILEESARHLKNGGTLVYSTCTLNPKENKEIVENFLAEHEDFALVPFKIGEIECDGYTELYPHEHHTDGFFIAKMTRR